MSKVFILHDNPHSPKNFISAEEYGELVVLFNYHISHVGLQRACSQLREKLRNISSDDWVITVGHPALICLAGKVISEKLGEIKLLMWDQQAARYIPARIK